MITKQISREELKIGGDREITTIRIRDRENREIIEIEREIERERERERERDTSVVSRWGSMDYPMWSIASLVQIIILQVSPVFANFLLYYFLMSRIINDCVSRSGCVFVRRETQNGVFFHIFGCTIRAIPVRCDVDRLFF